MSKIVFAPVRVNIKNQPPKGKKALIKSLQKWECNRKDQPKISLPEVAWMKRDPDTEDTR